MIIQMSRVWSKIIFFFFSQNIHCWPRDYLDVVVKCSVWVTQMECRHLRKCNPTQCVLVELSDLFMQLRPWCCSRILAKIKLTSPFGVTANVPDRWMTPYEHKHEHMLFYAIIPLILEEPSQGWRLLDSSLSVHETLEMFPGLDNQPGTLGHNSFAFVEFHVSERPQCSRSKLPLLAIGDTADQSLRVMKHKRPRITQSPAHVRHMVAFGLGGFSPGKQLPGNTTVVFAAHPKTQNGSFPLNPFGAVRPRHLVTSSRVSLPNTG